MRTRMRLIWRQLSKVMALTATAALLTACGGDDNKVNSDQLNSPTNDGTVNRSGVPYTNQQSSEIDQFKAQYPCSNGSRIQDMVFSVNSSMNVSGNTTKVEGQFNQGAIPGNVGNIYIGVSNFGDVMVVSKMTNGSQVVGYNVVLSMCTYDPLVIPGRQLSNFQAPYGIILDDDTNCGYGSVDLASLTRLQAAAYQMYPAAVVETTFTKTSCGSSTGGSFY